MSRVLRDVVILPGIPLSSGLYVSRTSFFGGTKFLSDHDLRPPNLDVYLDEGLDK